MEGTRTVLVEFCVLGCASRLLLAVSVHRINETKQTKLLLATGTVY